jgi:hypothetical protein
MPHRKEGPNDPQMQKNKPISSFKEIGLSLAPQTGLEPVTLRLTAECSAIELLRIIGKSGNVLLSQAVSRQVPSALKGLTSVFGMGTGVTLSPSSPDIARLYLDSRYKLMGVLRPQNYTMQSLIVIDQALDRLVSVSFIHYCTSTSDLSTS